MNALVLSGWILGWICALGLYLIVSSKKEGPRREVKAEFGGARRAAKNLVTYAIATLGGVIMAMYIARLSKVPSKEVAAAVVTGLVAFAFIALFVAVVIFAWIGVCSGIEKHDEKEELDAK